jgi:hypothetical protein
MPPVPEPAPEPGQDYLRLRVSRSPGHQVNPSHLRRNTRATTLRRTSPPTVTTPRARVALRRCPPAQRPQSRKAAMLGLRIPFLRRRYNRAGQRTTQGRTCRARLAPTSHNTSHTCRHRRSPAHPDRPITIARAATCTDPCRSGSGGEVAYMYGSAMAGRSRYMYSTA